MPKWEQLAKCGTKFTRTGVPHRRIAILILLHAYAVKAMLPHLIDSGQGLGVVGGSWGGSKAMNGWVAQGNVG